VIARANLGQFRGIGGFGTPTCQPIYPLLKESRIVGDGLDSIWQHNDDLFYVDSPAIPFQMVTIFDEATSILKYCGVEKN
jgi:hypothetical protein